MDAKQKAEVAVRLAMAQEQLDAVIKTVGEVKSDDPKVHEFLQHVEDRTTQIHCEIGEVKIHFDE